MDANGAMEETFLILGIHCGLVGVMYWLQGLGTKGQTIQTVSTCSCWCLFCKFSFLFQSGYNLAVGLFSCCFSLWSERKMVLFLCLSLCGFEILSLLKCHEDLGFLPHIEIGMLGNPNICVFEGVGSFWFNNQFGDHTLRACMPAQFNGKSPSALMLGQW